MGKIWVEVCLISARGLGRKSPFWKLQWFAVGWIDPNNKYCTKIDASGNANPIWKTKFATLVDDSNFHDMSLNVQVYSRDSIFLRERLQGTATVILKEFLANYSKGSESSRSGSPTEQVGSYQLRKRNSSKPQGFVDISIRISEEKKRSSSYPGNEGQVLLDHSNNVTLSAEGGSGPIDLTVAPFRRPENQSSNFPTNYYNPQAGGPNYLPEGGPSYHLPRYPPPPPPPPPPSNVGYVPTFMPNTDYINMPSSAAAPGRGSRPGLAMGVGAGALAAGAVIFGDDFMSGFDIPAGLQDPSITLSTDPPF